MESRESNGKIGGYLSQISYAKFDKRVGNLNEFTSKLQQGIRYFDQQLQKEAMKSFWEKNTTSELTRVLNYYPPAAYVNDKLWQHLQVETFKKAVDNQQLDHWYENLVHYAHEFLFDNQGNFSQEARTALPQLDDILTGKIKLQDKNGKPVDINDHKILAAFKKDFFTAMLSGSTLYQLQESLQTEREKPTSFTKYDNEFISLQGKISIKNYEHILAKKQPKKETKNSKKENLQLQEELILEENKTEWREISYTLEYNKNKIDRFINHKESNSKNTVVWKEIQTLLQIVIDQIKISTNQQILSDQDLINLEKNLMATQNALSSLAQQYQEPPTSIITKISNTLSKQETNHMKKMVSTTFSKIDKIRSLHQETRTQIMAGIKQKTSFILSEKN